MELLRHLKVIVPIGINLVESVRIKEYQTGSHLEGNRQQTYTKYFLEAKMFYFLPFNRN